jgi:hypothetical protein
LRQHDENVAQARGDSSKIRGELPTPVLYSFYELCSYYYMANYHARIESTNVSENTYVTANVSYIGDGLHLIEHLNSHGVSPDNLAFIQNTFFHDYGKIPPPLLVLDQLSGKSKHIDPPSAFRYHAYVHHFVNNLTRYKLDQREYPVLRQLKGVGFGLLMCCICYALEHQLVQSCSTIVLDATPMSWLVLDESTARLVQYYERIGFRQLYPDYYNNIVHANVPTIQAGVPMFAMVGDVISAYKRQSISKELLAFLPLSSKDLAP